MKKTLLFLSALLFVSSSIFAQTLPTTEWSDNANTQWHNTQDNSFTLSNEAELAGLSLLVAGGNDFSGITISIDSDLDLGAHLWSPIGVDEVNPFSGTFDGNNHTISNMVVNMPTIDMVGLFGRMINGTLLNINLENPIVYGFDSSGSLLGNAWQNGVITNCHATGVSIQSNGTNVGGLIGDMVENGSVTGCSSEGDVNGDAQVGGLLGSPHNNITISESYALGTVNANHLAGGLIGASVIGFPGTLENIIDNCYSHANVVVVNGHAGGLVGHATALISISNSYSVGTAVGPEFDGGFIGAGGSVGTSNNYWDTEASQHTDAVGGWQGAPGTPDITSKTTAEMKTTAMVDLLNDGDVNGPWKIDANLNDGYPGFIQGTVSIKTFNNINASINVYPNTFDAELNIESDTQLNSYVIYEISGKVIQADKLNGKQVKINTQTINSGVYMLMLNTNEGMVSKKIVK